MVTQESLDKLGNELRMLAVIKAMQGDKTEAKIKDAFDSTRKSYVNGWTVLKKGNETDANARAQKIIGEATEMVAKYTAPQKPIEQAPSAGDERYKLKHGDSLTKVVVKHDLVERARTAIGESKECRTAKQVDINTARNTAVLATALENSIPRIDYVQKDSSIVLPNKEKMQRAVDHICESGLMKKGKLTYAAISPITVERPLQWPVTLPEQGERKVANGK